MSTPPEKPGRRWFRISVRMMMLLILIIAVLIGWRVNRANTQRRAVAAIKKAGGEVEYDYQYSNSLFDPNATPRAPAWLRRQLGDEYFQEVECVTLSSSATDTTLASLEGCDRLKELDIIADPSKIGDGLVHLRGLVSLETLFLNGAGVTDAGLSHLRGMTRLKHLDLQSTKVTDAGLAPLEGLTELRILSIRNPPIRNPLLGPSSGP